MRGRLATKVALITGAARGIGRAVVRRFAAEGCTVHAVDVLDQELRDVADACRELHGAVHPHVADVSDADAVDALVADVVSTSGQIDVLANVAGIIFRRAVDETDVHAWDRLLGINLRGPFLLSRAVVPHMKRRGAGSIVNVSSRAATIGSAGEAAYCASKFGLEGLSRATARDVERFGIAVNTITPGVPIHTAMSETTYDDANRKVWQDPEVITEAFVHLALQTPAGVHDQYVDAWRMSQRLRALAATS